MCGFSGVQLFGAAGACSIFLFSFPFPFPFLFFFFFFLYSCFLFLFLHYGVLGDLGVGPGSGALGGFEMLSCLFLFFFFFLMVMTPFIIWSFVFLERFRISARDTQGPGILSKPGYEFISAAG